MTPLTPYTAAPIDCETAVKRLWDFLDEELDDRRYAEVEAHVAFCVGCAKHFEFAQAFLSAVGALRRSASEPAALRARVVAALQAEGFKSA